MADPCVLRERWFDVSALEFEAFLRDYPRPHRLFTLKARSSDVGFVENRTRGFKDR